MPRILASADIGSNTVHLLVAEVENGHMSRIGDTNEWISLGEIVGRQGKVPAALADRLIRILGDFKKIAVGQGAQAIYVFGTEAIRKASNQKQVLEAIRVATGIKVDIITGQREAELGLRGAWLDCAADGPFVLCEVGGGSAQVAQCVESEGLPFIEREQSLPIGTGTLIAQLGLEGPCSDEQFRELSNRVREALLDTPASSEGEGRRVIACGGVARGLWRALHPDGERVLAAEELDYLIWVTRQLTLDVIVDRFQVKPKRAATLLPGAVVYRFLLAQTGQGQLTVSRFGVREGAILMMSEGKITPTKL